MSQEFLAKKKEIDELKRNKANVSDVYTKQEVNNKITEKVSEIVAEAPEDFDTLREMSDWINNHEDSAAAMNTAINNKLDKTTTYAVSDRTGGAASRVKINPDSSNKADAPIFFKGYYNENYPDEVETYVDTDFTYKKLTKTLKVKNLEAENINESLNNKLDKTTTYAVSDRASGAASRLKVNPDSSSNVDNPVFFKGSYNSEYPNEVDTYVDTDFTYRKSTKTLKVKNLEAENINQALGNKLDKTTAYAASDRTGGAASRVKINSSSGSNTDNPVFFKGSYNSEYPNEVDIYSDSDFTYRKSTKTLKVKNLEAENINESLNNIGSSINKNKSDIAVNRTTLGIQCKNLIKPVYQTTTIQGVTFTVNSDNSVTANGTNNLPNSDANFKVFDEQLEPGIYTLTGSVNDTFRLRLGVGSSNTFVGKDIGDGFTFTVSEKARYVIMCQIPMSETANNVTFYPMLRYTDITDSTYEPYKPSLQEQINSKIENINQALNNKLDNDTTYAASDRTGGAAERLKIYPSGGSSVDAPIFFRGYYDESHPNEVDTYVDTDFTYKKLTKTLKVKNIESDSINALKTSIETNADNISTHETDISSINNTLSTYDSRITAAQQKADSVDKKADATNEVVGNLSNSLQSAFNSINNKLDKTTTYAASDRTGGAATKLKINPNGGSSVDAPIFFRGSYDVDYTDEVDTYVDTDFTYKKLTKTLKVKNLDAENINESLNNIGSSVNKNKSNIAINHTTLGIQCKNLIKPVYLTSTIQGVTFTVNSDNSVTANGTNNLPNSDANFKVFDEQLEPGTYTLTGAVSETFRMRLGVGPSNTNVGRDIGNGFTFTVSEKARYVILCQVPISETANNVTFYPMLRYADIQDDSYESYKPSLQEQIDNKVTSKILYSSDTGARSITLLDAPSNYDYLMIYISGIGAGTQCINIPGSGTYHNAIITGSPTPTQANTPYFIGILATLSDTNKTVSLTYGKKVSMSSSGNTLEDISNTSGYIIKVTGFKSN